MKTSGQIVPYLFRQHTASIYGFVRMLRLYATSTKKFRSLLDKVGGKNLNVDCSHKYKINQGFMVGGRRPSVEEDLWWKTTFCGRRPLVENNLWWKTTFGGRRPFVKDDFRWKMTFGGRRSWVEDNLGWKTTFGGRHPSVDPCMLSCLLCGNFFYKRFDVSQ